MDRTRYLKGTASGVVKDRTIERLPAGERWTGSLLDEALGGELTPNALEDDGGRVGIRAPVLQPHEAGAGLTLNGLDAQTIALDVPTQEQVVNKRWIIQNSAFPAWKQSC